MVNTIYFLVPKKSSKGITPPLHLNKLFAFWMPTQNATGACATMQLV